VLPPSHGGTKSISRVKNVPKLVIGNAETLARDDERREKEIRHAINSINYQEQIDYRQRGSAAAEKECDQCEDCQYGGCCQWDYDGCGDAQTSSGEDSNEDTLTPSSDKDAYGDLLTTSSDENDLECPPDNMMSPRRQIATSWTGGDAGRSAPKGSKRSVPFRKALPPRPLNAHLADSERLSEVCYIYSHCSPTFNLYHSYCNPPVLNLCWIKHFRDEYPHQGLMLRHLMRH